MYLQFSVHFAITKFHGVFDFRNPCFIVFSWDPNSPSCYWQRCGIRFFETPVFCPSTGLLCLWHCPTRIPVLPHHSCCGWTYRHTDFLCINISVHIKVRIPLISVYYCAEMCNLMLQPLEIMNPDQEFVPNYETHTRSVIICIYYSTSLLNMSNTILVTMLLL
jgi:hypothetical protein